MRKLTGFVALNVLFVIGLMVVPTTLSAQTAADSTAIVETALNYIDGFYTGDAERMERALHPDLAKRIVRTNPNNGQSTLDQMTAEQLIDVTRGMAQRPVPESERRSEVAILDIYGPIATVKIDAATWVDYIHMAKYSGEWKIINVLWEMRPRG